MQFLSAKNCTTFFPKSNTVAIAACETHINANCSLKCKNGYSLLNGSTVVTCLSSGNWSSEGPTCVGQYIMTMMMMALTPMMIMMMMKGDDDNRMKIMSAMKMNKVINKRQPFTFWDTV